MQKFIGFVEITEQELINRNQICSDFDKLFKNYLVNSTVKIFGSTMTGLATNGSDMDLTILIDEYLALNREKQVHKPLFINNTNEAKALKPQTSNTTNESSSNSSNESIEVDEKQEINNNVSYVDENLFEQKYKTLLSLELDEQINVIAKLLQRYAVDIQNIHKITNSRCPIVRFYHEKHKINCDITLNNYLAVENTRLIKLLLNLESHLKNLIFVIRYWSKQKALNGLFKFNSYTIIWMIIFYLQQIKCLPTVEFLARLDNVNEKLIHGWNCNYELDIEKINKEFVKNSQNYSFVELLKGFFEYYSTFNFISTSIINTRRGTIDTYEQNKVMNKLNCINIQDPFDLEHNLSANITDSIVDRFKLECLQACNVLKCCLTPHKSTNTASNAPKCWGLSMLFTRKTPEIIAPKETVNSCLINGIKIKLANEANANKVVELIVNLLKNSLLFDVTPESDISMAEEYLKQDFKRKRAPLLNQICTRVDSMGLNCSPKRLRVSDDPEKYVYVEEPKKLEDEENDSELSEDEFDDNNDENLFKLLTSYKLSIKQNTWQGRRNVRRDLLKQHGNNKNEELSIEFEKEVSLKLINENQNNNHAFDSKLFISLMHETDKMDNNDNAYLNIKFRLIDETKNQLKLMHFTTLIHFLDTYLNNMCQKNNEIKVE